MKTFGLGLLALALLTALPSSAAEAPKVDMTIMRLPNGVRFGLIGKRPSQPAPTLFVLQGNLDVAMKEPIYTEVARMLERDGVISVLLDAPAHGEDHRPEEPNELVAWRTRLEHNEDLIGGFTANARAVLDYLVREKYTDPSRVGACGTSRGGFLAFHLTAAEPRIRCVAGIAPLTHLTALREFKDTHHYAEADALNVARLAPRLAGRPAWVCIGNHDTRVDSDLVIQSTRALVNAAAAVLPAETSIPVEVVINTSIGHRSSKEDHALLAEWLRKQGITNQR
jgi:dienelactone hydrolase